MSLFDKLFGGGGSGGRGGSKKSNTRPSVSIEEVIQEVTAAAEEIDGLLPGRELTIARFQDALRARGIRPLPVFDVEEIADFEDGEVRARFTIIARMIEGPALAGALSAFGEDAGAMLTEESAQTVGEKQLLTLALIRKSAVRAEELARAFVMNIGLTISGESEAVSKERAARIDYGALLAEAERARMSAEERLEELRKLQEAQGRPRGKW